MKLLFLVLLSISTFANTAQCLKRICVGDYVMDQFGWSGAVDSFSSSKDELYVRSPIDGSLHSFPYEGTGKMVHCYQELCEEDIVKWHGQYDVEIYGIYDNGMATIWDIQASIMYVTKIKTLSK